MNCRFLFGLSAALATVPSVARAQFLQASTGTISTTKRESNSSMPPPGALQAQAKATSTEFGAVAQGAANTFLLTGIGVNAHACAGLANAPGNAYAYASSNGQVGTSVRLLSPTLATGTLVPVEFQYRASLSPRYIYSGLDGSPYVTLTANLAIVATSNGQEARGAGSYAFQRTFSNPQTNPTKTGMFDSESMVTRTLIVPVGGFIDFSAQLSVATEAAAARSDYNSADVKAGVVWGANALTAGCTLVYGPSNDPFPSLSNVAEPSLDAVIPPFQLPIDSGITAAPEPGSFALLWSGAAIGALFVIRSRTRR